MNTFIFFAHNFSVFGNVLHLIQARYSVHDRNVTLSLRCFRGILGLEVFIIGSGYLFE